MKSESTACPSCGSLNQRVFAGEIAIHPPGMKNIDKPAVWVFPQFTICLQCGTAQFCVPETELHLLAERVRD